MNDQGGDANRNDDWKLAIMSMTHLFSKMISFVKHLDQLDVT